MTGITEEMVMRALRAMDAFCEEDGSLIAALSKPAMKAVLTAALPGLAEGTMWIAPWEATESAWLSNTGTG